MSTEHLETRREAEAALAARRELGVEYEDAIAASLADRVERLALQRAVDNRRVVDRQERVRTEEQSARTQSFVLGIVSLGAGVPITAIAATNVDPGLLGVLVSWTGIVALNAVFAWRHRRRD